MHVSLDYGAGLNKVPECCYHTTKAQEKEAKLFLCPVAEAAQSIQITEERPYEPQTSPMEFHNVVLVAHMACSFLDRSAEPTVEPATQEVVQVTVTPEAVASLEPAQTAQTPPTEAAPVTTDGGCTLSAAYVADITIPDNTEVAPGASFTKTWRIRNSGSCTWEEGTQLVFASGEALGGPATVVVPRTTPNSAVDISVTLIGPQAAGTYRSNWQLQAPDGTRYGGSSTRRSSSKAQRRRHPPLLPPAPRI
jgi:hypothetical protein